MYKWLSRAAILAACAIGFSGANLGYSLFLTSLAAFAVLVSVEGISFLIRRERPHT